jgi:hypothetical protein
MNKKMIKGIRLFAFAAVALTAACGSPQGTPTEFAGACALDLDGKTLEVTGVLQPRSSMLCSNRGGRMDCPFELFEAAGSEKKFMADIAVGSGANTVTEIPKSFTKEDLKVRDNTGNQIALGTDRVKLTGKMSIAPAAPGGQGVCFMQVYKIER